MKEVYLRFIALANAISGESPALSTVDETAKQLLDVIASRHAQDKTMTVTDTMALANLASPATIHRKLDDLREAGLIEQIFSGNNRRTKYLVPTKTADKYFDSLGNLMKKSLAATKLN
jgi:DNA-binding MarR family transcriptional regulator